MKPQTASTIPNTLAHRGIGARLNSFVTSSALQLPFGGFYHGPGATDGNDEILAPLERGCQFAGQMVGVFGGSCGRAQGKPFPFYCRWG